MKKVKNMYWGGNKEWGGTGLFLEMEDGTWMAHYSTDPIQPFAPIDYNPVLGERLSQ